MVLKIKKRLLISVLLTIAVCAATYRFWLPVKVLDLKMYVVGHGPIKAEFLLNKYDNNEFKNVKYTIAEADLDNSVLVSSKIPNVHKIKRLKITIIPRGGGGKSLSVKAIALGDYLTVNDFKNFTVENAKVIFAGNELVIKPQSSSVSLIYNEPLNIKNKRIFDIKILFIILLVSFLSFYKLSYYLADFKSMCNASRIDIVFLVLFFSAVFVPLFSLDTRKSVILEENRPPEKYSPFLDEFNQVNFNFAKIFDKYFSDRFLFRSQMIYIYSDFRQKIAHNYFSINDAYINLNSNWMNFLFLNFPQEKRLSDEMLDDYLYSISELKKFCDRQNIKLYIIVAPGKPVIYSKEAYPLLRGHYEFEKSMQMQDFIQRKIGVKIIYPYKELLQEKITNYKNYTYFKTDHHWTPYGSYIGYKKLMEEITRDFPQTRVIPLTDFNVEKSKFPMYKNESNVATNGSLYNRLYLSGSKYFDVEYNYYINKNSKSLKQTLFNEAASRTFLYEYANSGNNLKAVIWGDSFSTFYFADFLAYNFKNTMHIEDVSPESSNFWMYENKIKDFHPDIMIICMTNSGVDRLNLLYKRRPF